MAPSSDGLSGSVLSGGVDRFGSVHTYRDDSRHAQIIRVARTMAISRDRNAVDATYVARVGDQRKSIEPPMNLSSVTAWRRRA